MTWALAVIRACLRCSASEAESRREGMSPLRAVRFGCVDPCGCTGRNGNATRPGLLPLFPGCPVSVEEGPDHDDTPVTYAVAAIARRDLFVTAACGTMTGAAVGAGTGAAIGAGTGYGAGKGALIGTGVGAAGGAIYDITR